MIAGNNVNVKYKITVQLYSALVRIHGNQAGRGGGDPRAPPLDLSLLIKLKFDVVGEQISRIDSERRKMASPQVKVHVF